jgi:anti-sigma factor RsiW
MNWSGCPRLDEVRQALAQGHWPDACAADLRAHVDRCTHCANEVLITTHLQRARTEAIAAARPGASNLLWLKAQARRRNAALERIGRPLAAAQAFAFVVILAAIAGIVAVHWHSLTDRASSLTAALSDWGLAPIMLAFGIGILTLLGCLAAYLTAERQ